MKRKQWIVYLIKCSDESLYCGITNNLKNRLAMHNSGRGAKYTRSRRPVELIAASSEMTKSNALKLEYRVKQVPASKKNFELTKEEETVMAMNMKKELESVKKNLETLSKKLEKMVAAASTPEKAKLKATKAKPAKKTVVKLRKKAVSKKRTGKTAPETIMDVIQNRTQGIDIGTLKEKTGFQSQKLYNTLSTLKKQGKIKSAGKGIYVKA